jgi:hypothetical protein
MRKFISSDAAKLGTALMLMLLFIQMVLYATNQVMLTQTTTLSDKYEHDQSAFEATLNNLSDNSTTFWDQIGLGFLDDVAKALANAGNVLIFMLGEVVNMMTLNVEIITAIPLIGNLIQYLFLGLWLFAILDFIMIG